MASGSQVIEGLRTMFIVEIFNGFQLNDNPLETNKIRPISLAQHHILVAKNKLRLRNKRNTRPRKLFFQALLVNGFQKTTPHFTIYLEYRTPYPITLFFVFQLSHFRVFSVFRG